MQVLSTVSNRIANDELSAKVRAIAFWIGERVLDVESFHVAAQRALAEFPGLYSRGSLSHGHPGAAMLLFALHELSGDERYKRASFEHLRAAVLSGPSDTSLHAGTAGMLAAASYCSDKGANYRSLRATLIEGLARDGQTKAAKRNKPESSLDFDLIGGVAGILLALRDQAPTEIKMHLAWIFGDPSRWAVPMLGGDSPELVHNLGASHGVTGALAALCLTTDPSEYRQEKMSLVDYIQGSARRVDGAMIWGWFAEQPWPASLISTWCYGTPSTASALCIAGRHLQRSELTDEGLRSLHLVAERSLQELQLVDFQICHGFVGVALVLSQIAELANDEVLREQSERIVRHVVDNFDARKEIGYELFLVNRYISCYGLLTGSIGVAMALLTAAGLICDSWVETCLALPSLSLLKSADALVASSLELT